MKYREIGDLLPVHWGQLAINASSHHYASQSAHTALMNPYFHGLEIHHHEKAVLPLLFD